MNLDTVEGFNIGCTNVYSVHTTAILLTCAFNLKPIEALVLNEEMRCTLLLYLCSYVYKSACGGFHEAHSLDEVPEKVTAMVSEH